MDLARQQAAWDLESGGPPVVGPGVRSGRADRALALLAQLDDRLQRAETAAGLPGSPLRLGRLDDAGTACLVGAPAPEAIARIVAALVAAGRREEAERIVAAPGTPIARIWPGISPTR